MEREHSHRKRPKEKPGNRQVRDTLYPAVVIIAFGAAAAIAAVPPAAISLLIFAVGRKGENPGKTR